MACVCTRRLTTEPRRETDRQVTDVSHTREIRKTGHKILEEKKQTWRNSKVDSTDLKISFRC